MSKKTPHPVDLKVGQRIRLARMAKGVSQTDLAEAIGVTFQQVQKYEKGANRVSASRMVQIAGALGYPVAWFFDAAAQSTEADVVTQMLTIPHGIDIARAVIAMETNLDRVLVAQFARRLAPALGAHKARKAA